MRMESSLLWAFPSFPSRRAAAGRPNRAAHIFEMRTYESPNDKTLARKIKMFGDGEIEIFRRLRYAPGVFRCRPSSGRTCRTSPTCWRSTTWRRARTLERLQRRPRMAEAARTWPGLPTPKW